MKISAVIPAYLEKENLHELNARLVKSLEDIGNEFDILYVIQADDGSKELLSSLDDKRVRFLYYPEPIGVAKAFLAGFEEVLGKTDYVLTMDADLNHQPEEIGGLWKKTVSEKADITIGSRYIAGGKILGMPLWKNVASRTMNKLINMFSGMNVNDKTSGFRIYKTRAIKCIVDNMKASNFEFYPESIIIANKYGMKFAETPITFKFRTRGVSKMYKFQTIKGYLSMFLRRIKA